MGLSTKGVINSEWNCLWKNSWQTWTCLFL